MKSIKLKEVLPNFDKELTDRLEQVGKPLEFKKGDLLMKKGQYFKTTFIILEGTVKLYSEGKEGEEFFLYFLEKGEACALSMICPTKNEVSELKARALTEVQVLAIPIQYMDDLMKNYTNWYYYVLENYRSRFEELLKVVDQIAFNDMDQKLEFYLKRQFLALKKNTINTTHQQIADDLNSSREVITRLLKKMESLKKISISRNEVTNLNLRFLT